MYLPLDSLSLQKQEVDSWYSCHKTTIPFENDHFDVNEVIEEPKLTKNTRNRKSKKPKANCTRRYRVYASPKVRNELKKWFGCVRKTYNWALDSLRKRNLPLNPYWLRNRFVNSSNIPTSMSYLLDTPKHVREGAIDELVDAYKINLRKGTAFDMKFRSKKEHQSIVIPRSGIKGIKDNNMTLYPQKLSDKIRVFVDVKIEYDCRMTFDKLGRMYLCVPFLKQEKRSSDNQAGIVALDPGVRTFMTAYGVKDQNTTISKFGQYDINRIYRMCKHLDDLVSKRSKNKKRSLKRAEHRMRKRIKDLVKDVHWKVVHELCSSYKEIIIPRFEVSQMVKRGRRKIGSKTVRCMLTWSHFGFRQKLLYKAPFYGCQVHVLGEEYTTKVCTSCGHYNPNIKGEKKIRCPCCHQVVDRDVSGARNIFIKNIVS